MDKLIPTILKIVIIFVFLLSPVYSARATEPLGVVINEIAWMGTKASSADEWVELSNNTNEDINLEGWGLYEAGGTVLIEPLTGIIKAKSYYLIERTDDTTISDIPASQEPSSWGGHGLKNSGEYLQLLDQSSTIIDEVNCTDGWFAGEGSPDYKTMERKNPQNSGYSPDNWATNNGTIVNGHDTDGNYINGTPKAGNSVSAATEEPPPQPTEEPPTQDEPQPETQQQEEGQSEPEPEPLATTTPEATTTSPTFPTTTEQAPPPTYPSGIFINEILPSPEGPDAENEWIEVFNANSFEVNLSGWQIKDKAGAVRTYICPMDTRIAPYGFLLVLRTESKVTLQNSGDTLELLNPNEEVVHNIDYPKAPQGQSYNRTESGWAWSTTPTPEKENIITQPEIPKSENLEMSKFQSREISEKETASQSFSTASDALLASLSSELPESSSRLLVFLLAAIIAISSAIIVLFLKKKLKTEDSL